MSPALHGASAVPGLESLPGLWSLTPVGLALGCLALLFLGLATGWLYTRRQHQEIVGLLRDALKVKTDEATEWREAHKASSGQLTKVTEALGIIPDFFSEVDAIRDEPEPTGGGGDHAQPRRARRAAAPGAGR